MHISEKAYNQNRKRSSKKANSANQNGIINKSNSFQCKSGQVKGVGGGGSYNISLFLIGQNPTHNSS